MPRISRLLDIPIVVLLLLILHILFFGGYYFYLDGMKFSATTPGKPALVLVAAFVLKIASMDWRSDLDKKLLVLYSSFFLIFIAGEVIA